jgi:hypothetical protein
MCRLDSDLDDFVPDGAGRLVCLRVGFFGDLEKFRALENSALIQ